ncbi:PHP domain-containing protein [Thermococcus atlanticus]
MLGMVGISDHIHYFTSATFNRYVSTIERFKKESEITVLAGIEANITPDGPDITEEMAKRLDYVIASAHVWLEPGRVNVYLELIKAALQDENVDVIGHFGNVFPYIGYPEEEELMEVIELAEANGKAFEISSRYKVPELSFVKACIQRGVKLTLGSDAHMPRDVGRIGWSLKLLRKAGGRMEDLLFSELL